MSTATRRAQQRRQRDETRERIVAAATEALRTAPYRDLGVDEVMRSAGLSRTLFYRHFDDLADLMLRVSQDALAELYESHERLEETAPYDLSLLGEALAPAVDAFRRHGPLIRALAEAASHDPAIEQAYEAVRERYVEFTERYLRRLEERGGARLADPRQTAVALTLLNEQYLLYTFGREPRATPEAALRTLTGIWTSALSG